MVSDKKPENPSEPEPQTPKRDTSPLWNPRPHLGLEDDQPLPEDQQRDEHQIDLRNISVAPPTTGRR
jgi:hypothetical protein